MLLCTERGRVSATADAARSARGTNVKRDENMLIMSVSVVNVIALVGRRGLRKAVGLSMPAVKGID